MGVDHALRRKIAIAAVPVGVAVVARKDNRHECGELFEVCASLFVYLKIFLMFGPLCREKLPRYDIDLSQMFPIQQDECEKGVSATMQRVVESTQLPVAADDGPRMPSEDDARYVVPRDEELSAKEIYDDFF